MVMEGITHHVLLIIILLSTIDIHINVPSAAMTVRFQQRNSVAVNISNIRRCIIYTYTHT